MSKKTKQWLQGLVLLCFLGGLLSCRKENLNGAATMAEPDATFSAMIGSVNWHTDSVSAFLVGDPRNHSKTMTITGYTAKRAIAISLRDTSSIADDSTMGVQSYPLDSWGNASAFAYGYNRIGYGPNVTWQQQGPGIVGEAVVTSSDGISKRISGTFSFTAKVLIIDTSGLLTDSINVTNGVFTNIPYSFLKHP